MNHLIFIRLSLTLSFSPPVTVLFLLVSLHGVATISRLPSLFRPLLLCYGVATISRLLKITGLFCRISSVL